MARKEQPAKSPQQLELFLASRYLNVEQVAEVLGVPKSFIYRRTARGHGDPIPHYRLGGHLRFKPDDVQEWIESHRTSRSTTRRQLLSPRCDRTPRPAPRSPRSERRAAGGRHELLARRSAHGSCEHPRRAIARVPSPGDPREAIRSCLSRSPREKEIGRMARVDQRRSQRAGDEPRDPQPEAPVHENEVEDDWVPPWEI